jgi:DNA-binding Lrp family transcriptional regulator
MTRDPMETRILVYIAKEGCVSVKDVMERYGLDKTEAQRLLESLAEEGRLDRRAVGVLIYCKPGARTPGRFRDLEKYYSGPPECLMVENLRRALIAVLREHRGHQAVIRPKHLISHMDIKCRIRSTALIWVVGHYLKQFRVAMVDSKRWLFDLDKLKALLSISF